MAAWADVLYDANLAEALIDRVHTRGRLLEHRVPSYRTRHIKLPSNAQSWRSRGCNGADADKGLSIGGGALKRPHFRR